MTRMTVAAVEKPATAKVRRLRLLSYTSLASSILLSGLVLAAPAFAADGTGAGGTDGANDAPGDVTVPVVVIDNPVVAPAPVAATGGNGTDSTAGTGTPGGPGTTGTPPAGSGDPGGPGGPGESANGTGGSPAGNGGSAVGGGIGPILIDRTGDITVSATVAATGQTGTGGNGGRGGDGTGANNATAPGGAGGAGGDTIVGVPGGAGGGGGNGGSAAGNGTNGGNGNSGEGGSVDTVTVDVSGNIEAATVVASGGAGTGGTGGAGGNGQGGTGALGGAGGAGGGYGDIALGDDTVGGAGGRGGGGSLVSAGGGWGGQGADGIGGNVGAISITAGGDIVSLVVVSNGGAGDAGDGGAGGSGTGGIGANGGAGGAGGSLGNISEGSDNKGGAGGAGGSGSTADGAGGDGSGSGSATGGNSGNILITAANLGTGTIVSNGGAATAGNGGHGGNGGAGLAGTAGAGGAGGVGGSIGNIAEGVNNDAGTGGAGGVGGSASGMGGNAGNGGDATAGSSGTIGIDVAGNMGNLTVVSAGGAATGGSGGIGGAGTGKLGGAGGIGGAGGSIGNLGNVIDGFATGNNAGDGGAGGAGGGKSTATGGSGGNGGNATAGDAGAIDIARNGDTAGVVTIVSGGGAVTGGTGGNGGAATAAAAGAGGTGGAGGSVGTLTNVGDTGNLAGTGGAGGTGGSGNDATAGDAGNGGDAMGGSASLTYTNNGTHNSTSSGITIVATGGHATAGDAGTGGAATAGDGGAGGTGGAGGIGGSGDGTGGSGGSGGDGGTANGGLGGNGGNATGGSVNVALTNTGDIITTGGTAITIVAAAGNGIGGDGGAGGDAKGGVGGAGGTGGAGGATTGNGGQGGDGGNGGDATGGAGGNGGDGQGGVAEVRVDNDGQILASGNGIDISATAGRGTGGAAGAGGVANITGSAVGALGAGGAGGTSGDPGLDGVAGTTAGTTTDGLGGTAGSGDNGRSSIVVNNTNLIDVDGIGLRASTFGDNGTIEVNNTGGTITGGAGGVLVATDIGDPNFVDNSDIDIVNSGVISSGNLLVAAAINAKGASTEILNSGTILGFMDLTEQGDQVENQAGGVFAARGTSDFRGGADRFTNSGTVASAGDVATIENVSLRNLENFDNLGLITMVDGQEGDTLTMTGNTVYGSTGGSLAVDALLGAPGTGKSDMLIIDGATSSTNGVTRVAVNVTGVSGANSDGITVVDVTNGGTTHDGDFVLDGGALNAGFFTWDLRRDGDTHELFTAGVGAGAYEFAAGITGMQDIWYQTTGTLLQRQVDLRPLLKGTQVTPVADYGEPVAPTPAGQVGPGFWMKGVGAWLERDQGDGLTVTDRKQSIYGGLAGFDFATDGAGDAWLFGLYGGYLGSKLKFNETNTEWTYDGPTVGAYATYLNEALYVDMLVKADFLSINIDPDEVAPGSDDEDTDGVNVGGMIDAGYKFGSGEGVFIEPQATLAVLHTSIDDVDMLGGTVEFEDETSVRGRLGLRLGYDHTAANQVVYSSDVTASVWQELNDGSNDVSIVTADFPAFGVSDEPGETVGDISLGFSVAAPEGWSGFLRGNYQFSDDLDAIAGSAGLRYSW